MIVCLSRNGLRARDIGTKTAINLSKNSWKRVKPGTTMNVHVTRNLGVRLIIPARGDLQAAYDHNLQNYFLEFKNAVPELANISLGDTEVTPLILDRCDGLEGIGYCTTELIETGDVGYDRKVFLYNARRKSTPDALAVAHRGKRPTALYMASWKRRHKLTVPGHQDVEGWILNESKLDRPSELCVVKHFQKGKVISTPNRLQSLCHLSHVSGL